MTDQWRRCADCVCAVATKNPATARLIGLCPLLAVSNTTLKAIALGIILGVVVIICGGITSVLRYCVSWRLKPMYHALVASFTTAGVVAYASVGHYEVIAAMGIYPALIASNCLVFSFMQEVAERESLVPAVIRGAREMVIVVMFLGLFGVIRELGAYGTMFTDSGLLKSALPLSIARPTGPLPLLATAPGALLTLAFVLAGVNAAARRHPPSEIIEPAPATAGLRTSSGIDRSSDPRTSKES
jgi:H+/Na+-translocating ferredoxin:NAD+ oxidoreductase subunit E